FFRVMLISSASIDSTRRRGAGEPRNTNASSMISTQSLIRSVLPLSRPRLVRVALPSSSDKIGKSIELLSLDHLKDAASPMLPAGLPLTVSLFQAFPLL